MVARLISESEKTRWVVALAAAWILLGLVPHDPWKSDEAYNFGIVWRMLEHGQWWQPHVGTLPYAAQTPALFHWSAALFAKLFGWALPLHDAARLASAAWVALALWGIGLTSRELYGRGHGRYAVLAFAGCIGLLERTHLLIVDNALLAALAFLLYGLARSRRGHSPAWWVISLSIAIAFLTKGILGLALSVACIAAFLWAARPEVWLAPALWRGFVGAALLIGVWAFAVSVNAPGALSAWAQSWFEPSESAALPLRWVRAVGQHAMTLVWFAFPALPLAAWSTHLIRRGFIGGPKQFSFRFLLAIAIAFFVVIVLTPQSRTTELMPILLPLALLAIPGLDHLKRGQSGFLDWIGVFFFGLGVLVSWLVWSHLYLGTPRGFIAKQINQFQPGFQDAIHALPVALAALLTVVWFAMIRPARRTHKRALVNWTVGVTALWGVFTLLLMPYVDFGKSYRAPVEAVVAQLPPDVRAGKACIASVNLGASQRAMFDYIGRLSPRPADAAHTHGCNWIIEQGSNVPQYTSNVPTPQFARVGTYARAGDKTEPWVLWKRK
jgi:4-amino-4-deoxy-L-arabinose transferase-like glycosyltransferase